MSRETEAGAITVPYALTTALVLEGLNGKTPLVAQGEGVTDFEPFSPNSYGGAQPDTESSTVIFDGLVASYPDTQLLSGIGSEPEPDVKIETFSLIPKEDVATQILKPVAIGRARADDVLWRGGVSHVARADNGWTRRGSNERYYIDPTPVEGTLKEDTVRGVLPETGATMVMPVVTETTATEALPTDDKLPRTAKWYNPADIGRYLHIKMRPESWTNKARIAIGLGGVAMAAAGAVMVYYNAKHGGMVPIIGSKHAGSFPTHDAIPTPHHALDTTTIPSPEQMPDATPTPATEQLPQEHFRTAVSYDQGTNRASNVHDWSVDALRDAGKNASLSNSQIDQLTHDRHNINHINDAFYGESKQVAKDPNHYLYAHTKYTTTDQEKVAHDIVSSWKSENEPVTSITVTPELPKAETNMTMTIDETDATYTPQITDEELKKMINEIENDPQYNPPVVIKSDPLDREGLFGLTEQEWMNVRKAVGVIAVATLVPGVSYQAKKRREERLIQERNGKNWGANGQGKKLKNHRNLRRKPTVPFGTSARKHWSS